jgi:prepilin-type N-terminal cleavage/methylation domain-containing protein
MFPKQNRNGFSVWELMVVLAIVAALAVFAQPSIKPFLEGIRLRTSVSAIKQQLIYAKTRALGDPNVHAGVYFNTTPPYSVVAFLDDDSTAVNDNQYTAGKDNILTSMHMVPQSDTLVLVSGGTNSVIFKGDGSARTSSRFFIYYTYLGIPRGYTISVLASTGRIRVERNY